MKRILIPSFALIMVNCLTMYVACTSEEPIDPTGTSQVEQGLCTAADQAACMCPGQHCTDPYLAEKDRTETYIAHEGAGSVDDTDVSCSAGVNEGTVNCYWSQAELGSAPGYSIHCIFVVDTNGNTTSWSCTCTGNGCIF